MSCSRAMLGQAQDGARHDDAAAVLGLLVEQVPDRADRRAQAHDERLALRVDRGVRDLGELLPEEARQEPRPLREHRERGVVAHRSDRLRPVARERLHDQLELLVGVAERRQELGGRALRRRLGIAVGREVEPDAMLREPRPVRAPAGEALLELARRRRRARAPCPGRAPGRGRCARARRRRRGRCRRTPTSDETTARPSRLRTKRAGRRPLRSSWATTRMPSLAITAAGPSHGSARQLEYS